MKDLEQRFSRPAALRAGLGVAVRTGHGLPDGIACAGDRFGLPALPAIELRLLRGANPSAAAADLCDALRRETLDRVGDG